MSETTLQIEDGTEIENVFVKKKKKKKCEITKSAPMTNFYVSVKGYIAASPALRGSITRRGTSSTPRNPSGGRGSNCNVPAIRCPCCKPPDAGIASSAPGRPRQIAA